MGPCWADPGAAAPEAVVPILKPSRQFQDANRVWEPGVRLEMVLVRTIRNAAVDQEPVRYRIRPCRDGKLHRAVMDGGHGLGRKGAVQLQEAVTDFLDVVRKSESVLRVGLPRQTASDIPRLRLGVSPLRQVGIVDEGVRTLAVERAGLIFLRSPFPSHRIEPELVLHNPAAETRTYVVDLVDRLQRGDAEAADLIGHVVRLKVSA